MSDQVKKLPRQDEVFGFLDMLRDSGKINMFAAGYYIESTYEATREQAKQYVLAWMKSYNVH